MTTFADDKINVDFKSGVSYEMSLKNIVGNGENAGYQHFLLFSQCFKSYLFQGSYKLELCGKLLTLYHAIPSFNDCPL